MKIGLGKFGKSVIFGDINKSVKSMTSGAIDAPTIYRSLLKYNPDHEFYLIGRSDFSRLSEEEQKKVAPHGNLIDPWKGYKEWLTTYTGPPEESHIQFLDEWRLTEKVNLDCAVFLPGHMLPLGVQGKSVNDKGTGLAKCLMASSIYAGPMYHYVNMTRVPYVMIVTDPRCYPGKNIDLFVPPKIVLSQINETLEVTHRKSYTDTKLFTDIVQSEYSGIETLYLMNDLKSEGITSFFDKPERDIQMMLFLNEGNPSRYEDVMKYVLGENNQIKIYGKWNKKILERDNRFEDVPMAQLTDYFDRIKYTFCIPIKTHWATGKFWDMIRIGIIPFVHPEYDTQKNIGFPEFLRVQSANELQEKMNFLDTNENEYNKLFDHLQNMITPDKKDGTFINMKIMNALERITT